jgi:hypothetical protein
MAGAAAAAPAAAASVVTARIAVERRPVRAPIPMENELGRRAAARTSAGSAAKSATGPGNAVAGPNVRSRPTWLKRMRAPSC